MIVWCGRCNTVPVDVAPGALDAVSWFGMAVERPWCMACLLNVMILWPHVGAVAVNHPHRRPMVDADTCGMGYEHPCPHGIRAGRYCPQCDVSLVT